MGFWKFWQCLNYIQKMQHLWTMTEPIAIFNERSCKAWITVLAVDIPSDNRHFIHLHPKGLKYVSLIHTVAAVRILPSPIWVSSSCDVMVIFRIRGRTWTFKKFLFLGVYGTNEGKQVDLVQHFDILIKNTLMVWNVRCHFTETNSK